MTVINKQYYSILDKLHREGKMKSPYRPWPNHTVAFMCIQNWVERDSRYGDWIELTDLGREIYRTAVVD